MKRLVLIGALSIAAAAPDVSPASARGFYGPPNFAAGRSMPAGTFIRMATISDTFEIESSRMALAKSRHPAIRDFARRMVADHGATSATLRRVVVARYGPTPPRLLDIRRTRLLNRLAAVTPGPRFDRLYTRLQVQSHREAVALHSSYANAGRDRALARVAARAVPIVRDHLAHARHLASGR